MAETGGKHIPDPGDLFDKEKYNTVIVRLDSDTRRETQAVDLLERLISEDLDRPGTEEIFRALKEKNAREIMVRAAVNAPGHKEQAMLVAACWECGLDFTPWFVEFTKLATSPDYRVALEALTVLQSCESVPEAAIGEALSIAEARPYGKDSLGAELIGFLRSIKNG